MDFDKVLEKYGLFGVMVLMLPYFIKTISPVFKGVFHFLFSFQEARVSEIKDENVRESLRLQAELQEQAKRAEHDRWMYENAFSVLKENLAWIRQQFVIVQKNEETALANIKRDLEILSGQITMLTQSIQLLQKMMYNNIEGAAPLADLETDDE